MLNTQPRGTLNLENLADYHYFNDFHLFLYSRTSNNTPLFFLHRNSQDQSFSHISGTFSKQDTSVILAIAKAFLTQTQGLLSAVNLKYITAENATPFDEKAEITLESLPVRPQLKFSPACDNICRLLAESPFHFQNPKGTKVQFIEVPMLNLEALKTIAEAKEISLEGRYYSLEDILDAKTDSEICGKLKGCLEDQQLLTYLDTFIIRGEPIENLKHYAILSCDIYNTNSLLPMFFYGPFKKHGESWKFYKVFNNELPTDEELAKLNGVIIPGSSCSAYDDKLAWYKGLFECINKIIYTYKHINLLGICFGAQTIAEALGGKTCKMDRDFIRGGDVQNLQPSFFELEYIKNLGLDFSLKLVLSEAHGDHISELPPEAVLHASSINTNVEIFTIGDNVLAIQAHPEVNEAWSAGAEYRWIKPKEEFEKFAEEFIKTNYPVETTHNEILKICHGFLKKETRAL